MCLHSSVYIYIYIHMRVCVYKIYIYIIQAMNAEMKPLEWTIIASILVIPVAVVWKLPTRLVQQELVTSSIFASLSFAEHHA